MKTAQRQFHGAHCCRAFTLIEILTVLSIIVVILALAVPAMNTLTGNNSLAGAQNQIASMLGTARADAIYNRQPMGVMFYTDLATGRTAMAEVQADQQATGGYTYVPTGVSTGNTAINNGPITALELANSYNPATTSFIYYRDQVLLPTGVGVALNNNSYGYVYNAATIPAPTPFDRYVRVGTILFDASGNLTSIPYGVQQTRTTPYGNFVNQLGMRLGLHAASGIVLASGDLASLVQPPIVGVPAGNYPLISQVGVLLYERNAYLNQPSFTESDINYQTPNQVASPTAALKASEEDWLDKNGTVLIVSPFNGELVKGK